jgi:hypothetical protein
VVHIQNDRKRKIEAARPIVGHGDGIGTRANSQPQAALRVGMVSRHIEVDCSMGHASAVTAGHRYIDVLHGSKMICCYQQQAAQGQHNEQRNESFITTSHAILQLSKCDLR